jgi:hypothetical protein
MQQLRRATGDAAAGVFVVQHVQLVQRLRRGDGEPNGLHLVAGVLELHHVAADDCE